MRRSLSLYLTGVIKTTRDDKLHVTRLSVSDISLDFFRLEQRRGRYFGADEVYKRLEISINVVRVKFQQALNNSLIYI